MYNEYNSGSQNDSTLYWPLLGAKDDFIFTTFMKHGYGA